MAKKTIETAVENPNLEAIRKKFIPFFNDNPNSTIEASLIGGEERFRITAPWNDNSFALEISDSDDDSLPLALNNVILPPRLSAIWHKNSKDLEIIWTAYRLPKSQREVSERSFSFQYLDNVYLCEFAEASSELMAVAKQFRPLTLSPSNFRNLASFHEYQTIDPSDIEKSGLDKPISFFVRNIDLRDDELVKFLSNLIFYTTYYDDSFPVIFIHDVYGEGEDVKFEPRSRYISGSFPEVIEASELDSTLLSFWASANSGNAMMRYLLYYRMIEYSALQYVDHKFKQEISRTLHSPDLKSNIPKSIEKLVSAFGAAKLDEIARFKSVVRECTHPSLLWNEVSKNLNYFSKEQKFDGGFVMRAIASPSSTEDNWCTNGVDIFADCIRKMRNALSHGKDLETAGVITPSRRNLNLLAPWVNLISIAAGEVVLYKDRI